MTDISKTGGPAFPLLPTDINVGWDGMTLRDWFAGQAIAGKAHHWDSPQGLSEAAYDVAEAMIAQKIKRDAR